MYEIREKGYEYKGYKLGQMTDKGMIIGFDKKCPLDCSFIAVESDKSIFNIEASGCASVILEGYDCSMHQWWCANEIEVSEELQNKPNSIQLIRKAINGHNIKLEFFQEEFCVSLYDSEIPICWDKQNGIHLLTETFSGNIDHEMMVEILSVMDIIRDNLEWFAEILLLKGENYAKL